MFFRITLEISFYLQQTDVITSRNALERNEIAWTIEEKKKIN